MCLGMQVDKAMKTLSRKLVAGQMLKEWKKRTCFVRPAEQRVLDQKETEKRLAKKRFKATMNAIMARRAQCVERSPVECFVVQLHHGTAQCF